MEPEADPERDARSHSAPGAHRTPGWPRGRWTRRALLQSGLVGAGGLVLLPILGPSAVSASPSSPAIRSSSELPPGTRGLLESSEFVYISPLRSDGSESRCHGEVWYGWLDETVVIITSRSSWKARAILHKGLDTARIWVGDHGRWKGWVWNNERFRSAPSFEARAEIDRDPSLLERLMQHYAKRYADEFGGWESRMRSGFESGERVLLRYVPVAASGTSDGPAAEDSAESERTATSRQLQSSSTGRIHRR
jgi:hypothetical protein